MFLQVTAVDLSLEFSQAETELPFPQIKTKLRTGLKCSCLLAEDPRSSGETWLNKYFIGGTLLGENCFLNAHESH